MGTRADFYIRRAGRELEPKDWIGSIAWDGYPDGIDASVLKAKTVGSFRRAINKTLSTRDDWTAPVDGWPWPWETSATTDYAYVFSSGKVRWTKCKYPDMRELANVTLGPRSGLIVISNAD